MTDAQVVRILDVKPWSLWAVGTWQPRALQMPRISPRVQSSTWEHTLVTYQQPESRTKGSQVLWGRNGPLGNQRPPQYGWGKIRRTDEREQTGSTKGTRKRALTSSNSQSQLDGPQQSPGAQGPARRGCSHLLGDAPHFPIPSVFPRPRKDLR